MKRGLLAASREWATLRERLGQRPFDHIYQTLQKRCALILESGPITETIWRSAYQQGQWGAATSAVASLQGRIFDLVICHRLDPNTAYRDRAVEELRNLVGFSTWVDPAHGDLSADLCTGEASATVAVALDWLAEELTEADRVRCIRALREKALKPYLQGVESGAFWHSCYHNWNAVVNGGVGISAILLADEEDAAPAVLAKVKASLKSFFNALGKEGGWDEGLGYWGYAMRYVLLFGEALDRVTGDGFVFHQRGMDVTGRFPVYFTPHGLPVSFGDLPIAPVWGVFYLLVKRFGLKEVAWWLDRYAFRHDVTTSGHSDAGLALLFRPRDVQPEPTPQLHPVKAFNEIGWAAVADRWPLPSLYAAMKTGDLSAHHAQLDMNSVQIAVDGEILVREPGSPPYSREYLSPNRRYEFYEVQSRSHNTITIRERGHRIDAVGSIIEVQADPAYRWMAGEGGAALGENVHFVRHVVLPTPAGAADGSLLVVVDEIRNAASEQIRATWHTDKELEFQPEHARALIRGESSALYVAFAGTCDFNVSTHTHPLASKRLDHAISVTTPPVSEAVLASVFSTGPTGKVSMRRSARGDLALNVGPCRLHWKAQRRHLRLERVEAAD